MKENMEAIYEKAVDAAQSAKRTAVLLATVSQKKLLIAREQEKIRRNYTRIGKVYYKDYVTDEEPDEAEYKPLCEEISNSFRYINDLRDEIEDAKEEYRAAKQEKENGGDAEIVPYAPEKPALTEKAAEPEQETNE